MLVVDDFEPWRAKIRESLQVLPEWTIVSQACDRPEAVQKAIATGIILPDLGLPTFKRIEATRIIQQRYPESRIIFLTMAEDREIMTEALGIRAQNTY
jgi:two-component system response regulator DegU